MKKIIALILVAFTFLGCGENIEFNTPTFQGNKDGNLWKANSFRANVNGLGVLTIVGSDNFETVTLQVNNTDLIVHDITETASSGSLLDFDGVLFSSNNFPDPSVQVFPASGMIDLLEVNIEEGYVSGEFFFNAFNSSGLSSVNINKGVFHRVPLVGFVVDSGGSVDTACASAESVTAATLVNFNGTPPGDANFSNVCNAYRIALETQKTTCGDPDNSIQTIINGLDCM
ncbi:DUF6252 family protein [Lacinutrix sp.]|uniref:DUF6252 family protein n=1 Tax=Lacinutrix sp. TaxID=1937692 RepID=UPI0025C052F8|nr:DUF6252 family protein [Lacinutrix sp.]